MALRNRTEQGSTLTQARMPKDNSGIYRLDYEKGFENEGGVLAI